MQRVYALAAFSSRHLRIRRWSCVRDTPIAVRPSFCFPRPNIIGDPLSAGFNQTINRWFDTSAFDFSVTCPAQNLVVTTFPGDPTKAFGDAPRYFSNIRNPGVNNVDLPPEGLRPPGRRSKAAPAVGRAAVVRNTRCRGGPAREDVAVRRDAACVSASQRTAPPNGPCVPSSPQAAPARHDGATCRSRDRGWRA